jgi:uroporphyrin-III C-methyltransferase
MGSSSYVPAGARATVGSVFLVGANPERPGELSWPALAAIAAADAVLHDGAVASETLALVPRHVFVEPLPGDLARVGKLAGEGWRVVWLVGGAPMHSPERRAEAARLREAGIATETIAGFLSDDDSMAVAVAAPQPLATALNGLAG